MTGGRLVRTLIGFSFVCTVLVVEGHSQPAWSPQKNVEFIVPTAAGSTMDALARIIQDIWQKNRLVNTSMTVMVRPGSGGAIAWTYVSRKTGDGHYLAISGPTLLANDIMGIGDLSYRDVTPIAQLFTEYTAFAVPADGPIRTSADLVKALKTAARHHGGGGRLRRKCVGVWLAASDKPCAGCAAQWHERTCVPA